MNASSYLLKKNLYSPELVLEPVWAYFRSGQGSNEPVVAIFENHEVQYIINIIKSIILLYLQVMQSVDPTFVISLSGAKYDLSSTPDCPFPFLTVSSSNGDKHVFTAETITEWQETLILATKLWIPPPPASAPPPQPQVRRSLGLGSSLSMMNVNNMLMRKSSLRSSLILSAGELTPQDRAIVAWINFCCNKTVVSSPASIAEGICYLKS